VFVCTFDIAARRRSAMMTSLACSAIGRRARLTGDGCGDRCRTRIAPLRSDPARGEQRSAIGGRLQSTAGRPLTAACSTKWTLIHDKQIERVRRQQLGAGLGAFHERPSPAT
jgi:hypothetical protein